MPATCVYTSGACQAFALATPSRPCQRLSLRHMMACVPYCVRTKEIAGGPGIGRIPFMGVNKSLKWRANGQVSKVQCYVTLLPRLLSFSESFKLRCMCIRAARRSALKPQVPQLHERIRGREECMQFLRRARSHSLRVAGCLQVCYQILLLPLIPEQVQSISERRETEVSNGVTLCSLCC